MYASIWLEDNLRPNVWYGRRSSHAITVAYASPTQCPLRACVSQAGRLLLAPSLYHKIRLWQEKSISCIHQGYHNLVTKRQGPLPSHSILILASPIPGPRAAAPSSPAVD